MKRYPDVPTIASLAFCPNSAANYGNLLHIQVTNFAKIAPVRTPPVRGGRWVAIDRNGATEIADGSWRRFKTIHYINGLQSLEGRRRGVAEPPFWSRRDAKSACRSAVGRPAPLGYVSSAGRRFAVP
jgi:hypothetical protein